MGSLSKVEQLIRKGVRIPVPQSMDIGDEVRVDRISGSGVTLYPGCRIYGSETLICDSAQIGYEGPATVQNCYVGPQVALKGGFFNSAVFLFGSSCGMGAHVRQGTIMEEGASIAHVVGLKQTILFPYVTLGSSINFCDCLMAGGTGRKNHSEVGSSYIHFNFTPNQDKATASLIGDVPRGVMLNQSPIFLGGQGGLVGPCRLAYGTVVAAGGICRKDQLEPGHLIIEGDPRSARLPYKPGGYRNLKRILGHNFNYIANLLALWQWYQRIRRLFIGTEFPLALADGLKATLDLAIEERIKQLGKLRDKLASEHTKAAGMEQVFCRHWPQIKARLHDLKSYEGSAQSGDEFQSWIEQAIRANGLDYIKTIKSLSMDQAEAGSQWLQSIVDHVNGTAVAGLTS
jgi:hypothetical protein